MSSDEEKYTVLYDTKLMKPGCVLLQALGGLSTDVFYEFFGDVNCWLTHPTPDMKCYVVTKDQLTILKGLTNYERLP